MVNDIHVHTQYRENYSTELEPSWKCKGGDTFVLTGFTLPTVGSVEDAARRAVNGMRDRIETHNAFCEVDIIDWELVPVGTPTQWERDQQEYEGRVTSKSERIQLPAPTAQEDRDRAATLRSVVVFNGESMTQREFLERKGRAA